MQEGGVVPLPCGGDSVPALLPASLWGTFTWKWFCAVGAVVGLEHPPCTAYSGVTLDK